MATIAIALSGMAAAVGIVRPLLPQIQAAFAPYGIDLAFSPGIDLPTDPETNAGWPKLIQLLEQRSYAANPPAPAHLVLTDIPPGYDRSINGMLLDRMRGVCAVYLGASLYGTQGAAGRPDLVAQVCIHELGHLMDLTHTDAGGVAYANAMMPASVRLNQAPLTAWQLAVADAASRGEVPVPVPNPALTYPFSAQCRACLRAAASDQRWWPFQSAFRGDYSGAANDQDRWLAVTAMPHGNQPAVLHGGVYFTLTIANRARQAIEFPARLAPEFGSLRLLTIGPSGRTRRHQARQHGCSEERHTLLPETSIQRSFAVIGDPDDPIFREHGPHTCRIELIDHHAHRPSTLGVAEFRLDVLADSAAERAAAAAAYLAAHGKSQANARAGGQPVLSSRPLGNHAVHFHHLLADAQRRRRGKVRTEQLRTCLDAAAPTAIRHAAARHLARPRLERGETLAKITADFSGTFAGSVHNELFEALKIMEEGCRALT